MWYVIGGLAAGFAPLAIIAWLSRRELRKARTHPDARGMRKPLTHAERAACANLQLLFESEAATETAAARERAQRKTRGAR